MKITNLKKVVLGTIILGISSSVTGGFSYASESTSISQSQVATNLDVKSYTEKLQPYVQILEDGTLSLNPTYKENVQVPEEVINSINNWMNIVNKDIKSGLAKVDSNYEIIYFNYSSPSPDLNQKYTQQLVSGGVDEFRTFWWGCEYWFSHATTNEIVIALTKGAVGTKLLEIIVKRVPMPQGKAATLGLELATLIAGGSAGLFKVKDKGNGIYITFARPVHPITLAMTRIDPQY